MIKQVLNNKFALFLIKAFVLYTFSYVLYEFVIKKMTTWDEKFIRLIINQCVAIFQFFGYKTFASRETNDIQVFGIDGSHGVWIGGPCNGITLMSLFAVFVIAYPGSFKYKLWYILIGMLIVHVVNLIRIIALALIANYSPQYLEFNHTYTFTFLAYSVVFGLWMLWANKYSKKESNS